MGKLKACYLHPDATEIPKKMLTHMNPWRGLQHWSWGHCVGMVPAWGKADGLLQQQGSHLQLAADGSSVLFRS